jgi:feruloyl-CoA synthase
MKVSGQAAIVTGGAAADSRAGRPMRKVAIGSSAVTVERRPDGTIDVRPVEKLAPYPTRLTDRLHHWAALAPDRIFIAERDRSGAWRAVTYAETLTAVRRLGQSLLDRDLSAERPLLILSGNSVNHALLGLAALYVGIPYCPVSPAYSLVSSDHGKLRHVAELLTPGLVYADDAAAFAKAIAVAAQRHVDVVVDDVGADASGRAVTFADFAAREATIAVDLAHDRVGPDTIGKFLLTSGSTGLPKAVINTQRMLTSNQVMLRETLAFMKEEPPVLIDWLPWNHTFGGNHNVGLVLFNGGSLYIDEGKPTQAGLEATIRNLREIAPTVYFNVPKGWEMLVPRLQADRALREHFYSRLQLTFFAGAGLATHVWDALDDLALETVGARIPMLTGLGATETAPFALSVTPETSRSGHVGLPVPGNDLKLVPDGGKLEARVKGPNVTPGYWRQPELTSAAFDEEGYYKFGDALRFVDENDITQGFAFDGRISEDFKLASGTWVSVGPLRMRLIEACAPIVRDFVIAGLNRDEIAVLAIPDVDACRACCADLPADAPLPKLLAHERLRATLRDGLRAAAARSTGSSNRVTRGMFIDTPLSIDQGEITDKGSVNQRAVLHHRAALVEELFGSEVSERIIVVATK